MVKHRPAIHLDRTFMALADATRRTILARLTRGPAAVGDIARPFRMTWPGVTKHLKMLERADLIRRERIGRTHVMRLNAASLREAQQWMERYRRFWEDQFAALEVLLDQTPRVRRKKGKHVQDP